MSGDWKQRLNALVDLAVPGFFLLLGLWLVVIRPLGPNLALIPGDLGDVRFNNYILEHFFRWISGLDKSYWTMPIFYPFPNTTAFSDNLLGSAPFYAIFRWIGLDRESAYQGWYILGFILNYLSVAFVLSRFKLRPLAIAAGAFFFAFGLPILAQENHPQLLYRFGVPLACFFLWQLAQKPRLRALVFLVAMSVFQLYLGIYNGVFLLLLLGGMAVLLPFCLPLKAFSDRLKFWPRQLRASWRTVSMTERILGLISLAGTGAALGLLLWPYSQVSKMYGFSRHWDEVLSMLPRWRSYLLADNSSWWQSLSAAVSGIPVRHEHQLFPGVLALLIPICLLVFLWQFESLKRAIILLHLGMAGFLVVLTLFYRGSSLYYFVWLLPGLNSIRAVTRIIMIIMYPMAVLIAYGIDGICRIKFRFPLVPVVFAILLTAFLVMEPVLYNHGTFSKADSQARIAALRQKIPAKIPEDPILFLNSQPLLPEWVSEVDAMMLGQELGWPIFNGYSGNSPLGYGGRTEYCSQLPKRILLYMGWVHQKNERFYLDMIQRAVPVGFTDCDPGWWTKMPAYEDVSK